MKNQYVGDVNDFAKYGLLNWLSGRRSAAARLRLGLVWYLTQDLASPEGGRIQYLDLPRPNAYSAADGALLDRLTQIVREAQRDISQIEQRQVLPADTVFFSRPMVPADRREWFEDAVRATSGCDLVFLDPDKGLARSAVFRPRPEYATLDEVYRLNARGQTVIVIQFLHRLERHAAQLRSWTKDLTSVLPCDAPPPFALRWHGMASLGFLVVPGVRHASTITRRIRRLLTSPWASLFDSSPLTPELAQRGFVYWLARQAADQGRLAPH